MLQKHILYITDRKKAWTPRKFSIEKGFKPVIFHLLNEECEKESYLLHKVSKYFLNQVYIHVKSQVSNIPEPPTTLRTVGNKMQLSLKTI